MTSSLIHLIYAEQGLHQPHLASLGVLDLLISDPSTLVTLMLPRDFAVRELVEVVVEAIQEDGADILQTLAEFTSASSFELSLPRSCNVIKRDVLLGLRVRC
jgi:hypothetical protein